MNKVNSDNNFIRIFRLPTEYPEGFCFNGGFPVNIQMVDWFNPVSPMELWGDKEIKASGDEWENRQDDLAKFIQSKTYAMAYPDNEHLAITAWGGCFIVRSVNEHKRLTGQ